MTAPSLAVAIVHYRAEPLLRECLARLAAAAPGDWTACVVDNGSDDGLAWLGPDPRIRLVRPGRNLGFAAGVNLALRHLPRTSHVLLLNPDVLLEQDTVKVVLRALESDPQLGAATCRLLLPDGRTDPACRRADPTLASAFAKQSGLTQLFPRQAWLGRYQMSDVDSRRPHRVDSASGAFLLVRRAALDAVGGLDERYFLYGEDLDLCRTIRRAGWWIEYRPETTALHVKGSGRLRSGATTLHFYRAMWTYYRKWGRQRRNPLVLAPVAAAIVALGTLELIRNGWRASRTRTSGTARLPAPPPSHPAP